ncbi:hypothetical protein HAX54_044745, partial [Datura stramonium]|nr:hypothetical protein [Datura stramonium]
LSPVDLFRGSGTALVSNSHEVQGNRSPIYSLCSTYGLSPCFTCSGGSAATRDSHSED